MFGKTIREAPKDAQLESHKLLVQAGFIRESVAGRFYFLPLGMRVRQKLMQIIREEMNKIGGQEMITPALHPIELWEETNRTEAVNFELMQIKDRRGAGFALGGTAEEMLVDLVRKFQISYKEMPFTLYQFSPKFRDEMRARGGLLRVREFLMKDAYSFDTDEEAFKKTYQDEWEAYSAIFKRVELDAKPVAADGGYIGGDYCHEFIVDCGAGESRYLEAEDGSYCAHEDIAEFSMRDENMDENEEEFKIIDQPEWVHTMDDNVKHYKKDPMYFLKNVVYKNFEGDIVIVTIRGDMEVNKIKLKNLLGENAELEEATDEDLAKIGTKTGYVHSWGHKFLKPEKTKSGKRDAKVIYIADNSLKTIKNFIGGQKEEKTDSINVNYGRDFKHEIEGDTAMAQAGFLAPNGKSKLVEKQGVEVGNIFQLGYHYTNKMANALFTDKDGKRQKYYMGCYGIGVDRTLATVIEMHNDDKGIIWPKSIAPYHVQFITLGNEQDILNQAENLYKTLVEENIEVLWDDRDERPGEKFADADLIGIPLRIVLSKRSIENGGVEIKFRTEKDSKIIGIDEILDFVKKYVSEG